MQFSESTGTFFTVTVAYRCADANNDVSDCSDKSATGGLGSGIVAFEKRSTLNRITSVRNRATSHRGALVQPDATVPGTGGPGTEIDTVVANNLAGKSFGKGQNCLGPAFTHGNGSFRWSPTIGTCEWGCD